MKLQEKHLEAIQQSKSENYYPKYSEYFEEDMCREKATQITKDYMKRFNLWMWEQNIISKSAIEPLFGYIGGNNLFTIDELIQIFLETEK